MLCPRHVSAECDESGLVSKYERKKLEELDPVGSTVRYEMMKLCTRSVEDTMRRQQLVIDDTGSVEGIYCTKWRSGQVLPMPHSQTTLKDRATQLLKYKSGALVTQ